MAAWPLIVRELRELSRQGQLFWIRVFAAIAFGTTAFLTCKLVRVLFGAFGHWGETEKLGRFLNLEFFREDWFLGEE